LYVAVCLPRDSLAAEIFDLYATKLDALRLAVDAALTVLRVDQIVMAKPAGGPKVKNAATTTKFGYGVLILFVSVFDVVVLPS
jgi:hypothetical protein